MKGDLPGGQAPPPRAGRFWAWAVLVVAGANQGLWNLWHAFGTGMPTPLAIATGSVPVLLAMGTSVLVTRAQAGWMLRALTYGVMLAAIGISVLAQYDLLVKWTNSHVVAVLFPAVSDLAVLIGLHMLMTPVPVPIAAPAEAPAVGAAGTVPRTGQESGAGTVPRTGVGAAGLDRADRDAGPVAGPVPYRAAVPGGRTGGAVPSGPVEAVPAGGRTERPRTVDARTGQPGRALGIGAPEPAKRAEPAERDELPEPAAGPARQAGPAERAVKAAGGVAGGPGEAVRQGAGRLVPSTGRSDKDVVAGLLAALDRAPIRSVRQMRDLTGARKDRAERLLEEYRRRLADDGPALGGPAGVPGAGQESLELEPVPA